MRAFKHVPQGFADAFESGEEIAVGTFNYYRSQEGDRADPLEGLAISAPGPVAVDRSSAARQLRPDERRALKSVGIDLGGALVWNASFSNNRRVTVLPPAYLFCCSQKPDPAYIRKGHVVFEITGLLLFAKLIAGAYPLLLDAPIVRKVSYAAREVDTLNAEPPPVGPFFKSIECADEKEVRVVWSIPAGQDAPPWQLLRCPEAASLVRRLSL